MREHKYRAWGDSTWRYSDENGLSAFFYAIEDGQYDSETLGEYTGLKDKNGKEIYEGDLVIDDWYPSDPHPTELPLDGKYRVTYMAPGWQLEPMNENFSGIYDFNDFGDMKVIGNIYENPDLLEKK